MTCGSSSIVIDGEEEREDFKAMELYLESPLNVDVDIMPPSEAEKLFRAFAEERKRALPQFTPDGIPITLENKFDDAIYNYLYEYWKTNSGEYDPKDDEIIMTKENSFTKNEKKFEQWLLQQYGMTNKEQREYTLKGNLESLWEIFSAADMVLLVKALPNIGKNLVQLGKDVLENGIQFDTSLGIVAGGGEIWNLKNAVDDVAEEAIEKTVKREVVGETVEKTVKTEVTEEVAENTTKKEMADTTEDLSQKTADKDKTLEENSIVKEISKSKSIEDILKDAKETANNAGIARNFDKSGGFQKTLEDFHALKPLNVKDIQTQYGSGKVGVLSNGAKVVARPGSKTGGATLEIKVSNSKIYKIRY